MKHLHLIHLFHGSETRMQNEMMTSSSDNKRKLVKFALCYRSEWIRIHVAKHADSQCRSCECDSSMRHNKISIGKEWNGKPPHKVGLHRKNLELYLWFLLRSASTMQSSFSIEQIIRLKM